MSDFLSGLYPDALKPPKSRFYDPTAPATPAGYQPPSTPASEPIPAAYQPPGSVTAPNISASPTSPNLTRDLYAPQLNDVTQKLNAAYQAPRPGLARQIFGGIVTGMNPRNPIGGLISGETQRQQTIQPLTQQEDLLSKIIQANRSQALGDAELSNKAASTDYLKSHSDYLNRMADVKENPAAKQPTNPMELFLSDPAKAKEYLSLVADNRPEKTPNEKEQAISDYLKGHGLPDTPAARDRARSVLATRDRPAKEPKDPDIADLNKQLKQAQLDKMKEGMDAVSPGTQKILQTTTPTIQQVDRLLDTLEPAKNDNTPFSSFGGRLKYKMGMGSKGDEKAGDIQKQLGEMEMDRVLGAARVLSGSSRAYQALLLAREHTPDPWKDSKKLMYEKLSTIRQNLQDVSDDAVKYGKKSGHIPETPGPRVAPPSGGGMVRARDPQGQLHQAPAGTPLPAGWKPE